MRLRYPQLIMLASLVILNIIAYEASGQTFQFQAEDFIEQQGPSWEILSVPYTAAASGHAERAAELIDSDGNKILEFTIAEAFGDAFIGDPSSDGSCCGDGDWIKYEFSVPVTGTWYIWARAIAPTRAENAWHWGLDIDGSDIEAGNNDRNPSLNIWDLFEGSQFTWSSDWLWYPINSRNGPFPGLEVDQLTDNRVGLEISAGSHTWHVVDRERAYIDMFWATMEQAQNPNVNAPDVVSVEPRGKLAAKWGNIKRSF